INAGTLMVAEDADLGNTAGAVRFGGGTFENTATFALATTRAVILNGVGGTFKTDPGTELTLGQAIGGGGGLTKTGSGTLTLDGSSPNTFTGPVNVNDGTLVLRKPDGVRDIAGALIVGDGIGAVGSAIVSTPSSNHLNPASGITIQRDGQLILGT